MCPRVVGEATLREVEGTDGDLSSDIAKARAWLDHAQAPTGATETARKGVPDGAGKPEETTQVRCPKQKQSNVKSESTETYDVRGQRHQRAALQQREHRL